jgi:hypothetical protein
MKIAASFTSLLELNNCVPAVFGLTASFARHVQNSGVPLLIFGVATLNFKELKYFI